MGGRRLAGAMAVTALGVVTMMVGAGAGAAEPPSGAVRGAGTVTLPPAFDDTAGDRVTFEVAASGRGTDARGHFTVVHVDDRGGLYARAQGEITCLTVADGVAVATGVIRHAWFRDFPGASVEGTSATITAADNGGADTIGFAFEFFPATIVACRGVPPFVPVERGNFSVR